MSRLNRAIKNVRRTEFDIWEHKYIVHTSRHHMAILKRSARRALRHLNKMLLREALTE